MGSGEETSPDGETGLSEKELNRLIDASFAEREAGEIVTGRVVRVTPEHVIIDIGSKSEGAVPFEEFLGPDNADRVFVGQEVEVMVVQAEDAEGTPVLSRRRAVEERSHRMVRRALKTGEGVPCQIEGITKGGLRADVGGMKGFIPFSQSGVRRGNEEELRALVGTQIRARVIEMRGKSDLILSRRAYLEDQRQRKKEETLAKLQPGARVTGTVKSITAFGAFVDLGGVDGLVHVSDLSWQKVNHPAQVVQVGQTLELVVREIDGDKVSLSLKHLLPDPWENLETKYPPGTVVHGKVTGTAKYGAFVELEPGIEGLVHISELSWTQRVRKPTEVLHKGEEIEVKILGIDPVKRRISLGYRQTMPDPWELAAERYSKLDTVEGNVSGITEYGVFVRLPEGIDGMIHVSDISWTKKVTNPAEVFHKGQKVRAVILEVDPAKRRISLGIKQGEADPWKAAAAIYHVGSNVEVKVVKLTDFGVFVELPDGLEGLVHISELGPRKISHPSEVVEEGDQVMMKIIKFDPRKRKLSLSLRQYLREQERGEVEQYLNGSDAAGTTLGEILGRALQEKQEARERESPAPGAEAAPDESKDGGAEAEPTAAPEPAPFGELTPPTEAAARVPREEADQGTAAEGKDRGPEPPERPPGGPSPSAPEGGGVEPEASDTAGPGGTESDRPGGA